MSDQPTLLIIDDDADIVVITKAFFERRGFHVVTGLSGEDALNRVKSVRPQVVILDVMMPQMDGFWLCRVLKSDPEFERVPVIFLSARDDQAARDEARKSGGALYLSKPFDLDDLENHVRSLLAQTEKSALVAALDKRLHLGDRAAMLGKLSAGDLQTLLERVDAALSH